MQINSDLLNEQDNPLLTLMRKPRELKSSSSPPARNYFESIRQRLHYSGSPGLSLANHVACKWGKSILRDLPSIFFIVAGARMMLCQSAMIRCWNQ
jgi:hypothetical protein